MGQPLRVLVPEGLPELCQMVVAVGGERAHELLDAAAQQDVVRGSGCSSSNCLPHELVVELPRPGQGPLGRDSCADWPPRPRRGKSCLPRAEILGLTPSSGCSTNLFALLCPTHSNILFPILPDLLVRAKVRAAKKTVQKRQGGTWGPGLTAQTNLAAAV